MDCCSCFLRAGAREKGDAHRGAGHDVLAMGRGGGEEGRGVVEFRPRGEHEDGGDEKIESPRKPDIIRLRGCRDFPGRCREYPHRARLLCDLWRDA